MRDVNSVRRTSCYGLLRATVAPNAIVVSTASWAANPPRYCSATARQQYKACGSEIADDLSTALAICLSLSERDERDDCRAQAQTDLAEGKQRCLEQRGAREKLCGQLGESRYAPEFDDDDFDDDSNNLTKPNPYRPWKLAISGSTRVMARQSRLKFVIKPN